MNHFFENKTTQDCFKRLVAKLSQEEKSEFRGMLAKAWKEKQFSEDDNLSTYSLTSEEVKDIYDIVLANHQK